MRRFIASLSSAALLASLLAAATAPSVGAVTCTATGFVRDGIDMTAALINPAGTVSGEVDASGCNIGVFYGTGSGFVQGADIHGANYFGVAVIGDSSNVAVDVLDSDIHDIGESPFDGSQHGVAIYYRATGSGTATGTIARNDVWDYQKGGIVASNTGTFVTITDNVVTGASPVSYIAQNGIQLGYHAGGSVIGNVIDGNSYAGSGWVATGLLLFDVSANEIKVSRNTYRNNQRNLVLVTDQACPSMYGGIYDTWGLCL